MKTTLIGYTMPTLEMQERGIAEGQDLIAYCARVSNPKNQYNTETADDLVKYLIRHQHWSPLEMVNAVVEIRTTRDIARQILRHRSFSFQEFSQRYADPTKAFEFNFVVREARLQDSANRQNSIETNDLDLQRAWEEHQREVIRVSTAAYHWALRHGIAKECARVVLPEGNTVSVLEMNGTIRSWIHYLELRVGVETQKEHRLLAVEIAKAVSGAFPIVGNRLEQQCRNLRE